MSHPWSPEGPVFEFPTPYRVENRLLKLRAALLVVLAAVLVLVVELVTEADSALGQAPVGPAGNWPFLLAAAFMLALAALELLGAFMQRRLLLTPGQPSSLAAEMRRESVGVSPGAPALARMLEHGDALALPVAGPYARWLVALAPQLVHAPAPLAAYLRMRIAHGLCAAGLLVLALALWWLPVTPGRSAAAALIVGAAGVALVLRHLQGLDKAVFNGWGVVGIWATVLVLALAVGWLAGKVALLAALGQLSLPLAAVVLMAGLVVLDALGVQAARAQARVPTQAAPVAAEQAALPVLDDVGALLREVDLALFRSWAQGVPNRRYAWQPPLAGAHDDAVTGLAIEESQPVPAEAAPGAPAPASGGWLWALALLGLACLLAGAGTWIWLAYQRMRDPSVPWQPLGLGLAFIILGVHAQRLAHPLWSRVEADSFLTELKFDLSGSAAQVRARVARLRSVFYAAALHKGGSRGVLAVTAEPHAARAWVQQLQALARRLAAAPAAGAEPVSTPRARERADFRPEATTPPPRSTAATGPAPRFCAACGKPVATNARFCQHCGTALVTARV